MGIVARRDIMCGSLGSRSMHSRPCFVNGFCRDRTGGLFRAIVLNGQVPIAPDQIGPVVRQFNTRNRLWWDLAMYLPFVGVSLSV